MCSHSQRNMDFMSHILWRSCFTQRWALKFPFHLFSCRGVNLKLQAAMKQQDVHLIWRACCIALHSKLTFNKIVLMKVLIVFVSSTGYYYNSTGLLACEPFFSKPSYRILASCAFYFPTTMVLMYCYGSSFHANRFRLASMQGGLAVPAAITEKVNHFEIVYSHLKPICELFMRTLCNFFGIFVSIVSNSVNHWVAINHVVHSEFRHCCNLITWIA